MAAQKQILHELLQEDQEPFQLESYITERRSQFKKNAVRLKKRRPTIQETSQRNRNLCFLSFQNSPDIRDSPFLDLPSPAKIPCESQNRAMFLQIPSTTAALLVEAAVKIQKQRQSKTKGRAENLGFGLLGSFLKRLKTRSRNNKRGLGDSGFRASGEKSLHPDAVVEEATRISCSCSNRRLSSGAWTENNEDKSLDFEGSTSDFGSECSEETNVDLAFGKPRFCTSPFIFSFHQSPSFSVKNTSEFCSPAVSPVHGLKQSVTSDPNFPREPDWSLIGWGNNLQDNQNCETRDSTREGGGEDKEQSSPASILDPPFEDDDGLGSADAEEEMDDYDLDRSYESVQRAKQQLLYRLRRFERLAGLDPIELEKKLSEGYSDDDESQYSNSEEHETLPNKGKHNSESLVTSDLRVHNMEHDCEKMKSSLDVCKETEIGMIEMLIGVDFKSERDGWTKFDEQVDEITMEMQSAICGVLVEQLWGELLIPVKAVDQAAVKLNWD